MPPTGLLSGMPAAGTTGTYPLTFKAANGLGADASQSFILIVDQSATGSTSSVSGSVFLDLAANGVLANGDPTLAGRTVFLDKNGNGVLDPGELSAVTNSAGASPSATCLPAPISCALRPSRATSSHGPAAERSPCKRELPLCGRA